MTGNFSLPLLIIRESVCGPIMHYVCNSFVVRSTVDFHSCSRPLLICSQDVGKNLLHGANIPEQPGGLSLHRLRLQHHIPPDRLSSEPPLLQPPTRQIPQRPSAVRADVEHLCGGRWEPVISSQLKQQVPSVCCWLQPLKDEAIS